MGFALKLMDTFGGGWNQQECQVLGGQGCTSVALCWWRAAPHAEEAGFSMPGEARPRPEPSCPPWDLPGVAQSRLPSVADGPVNYPFLHCLVEEFECADCEARHQSINHHF